MFTGKLVSGLQGPYNSKLLIKFASVIVHGNSAKSVGKSSWRFSILFKSIIIKILIIIWHNKKISNTFVVIEKKSKLKLLKCVGTY